MNNLLIALHHPHRDFWLEAGFILSQIGMAAWEGGRFAAQIILSHSFLAFVVLAEIIMLSLFARRKWVTGISMILERFIVFNPVLNLFRHKPFFYTNATGSWMDAHFPKGSYPWLWASAVIVLILFKLLKHKRL